jgi:hypothetical protein
VAARLRRFAEQQMETIMLGMKLGVKAGFLFGSALVALASCTSADTRAEATAAGIEASCINPIDIKRQQVVSDQEIRFEMKNGDVWVNTLKSSCPGLKFRQGFEWQVRGTLVCSNQQTITVKDEGTVCMLGAFAKAPAKAS